MSLVTAGYGQPTHRAEYDINIEAAVGQTLSALHFSLKVDTANTLDYTHEYQLASIDLRDDAFAFAVQTGTMRAACPSSGLD